MHHADNFEENKDVIKMDTVRGVYILEKNGFASGEYCVSDALKKALKLLASKIKVLLETDPHTIVLIEGHADQDPVLGSPKRDDCNLHCYVKDNIDLALCRARQAREELISAVDMNSNLSERISVVSYGLNRLVANETDKSLNRRVEIKIETSF